jgi:hypothetical protein
MVRLGGGQGYYGDDPAAVDALLASGVDYLGLEALGEITLTILAKNRRQDPSTGYTKDFPAYLERALPFIADRQTRLVTNSGGMNPRAGAAAAAAQAASRGMAGLRVAAITGDDLLSRVTDLPSEGATLENSETGQPWSEFPVSTDAIIFANAYLGAGPIVQGLGRDADIVVGGRIADPSLFLAPLMHEFGWKTDAWDELALGTVVGHLCECSAQSTGGNYSGDWWTIPDPWNLGYPIAECSNDGRAVLTKAAGTGGRVDFDTVRQQLLYEVHDPNRYVTPDAVADMTSVSLREVGDDRVAIEGVRGRPATDSYKVLLAYPMGWAAETRVAFGWPDAYEKAAATAAIFRERTRRAGFEADEWVEEYWGVDALHGAVSPFDLTTNVPEVLLRVCWRCPDRAMAKAMAAQMPPLRLSGPPWGITATGQNGMLGLPTEVVGIWPTLVPKELIDPHVEVTLVTS